MKLGDVLKVMGIVFVGFMLIAEILVYTITPRIDYCLNCGSDNFRYEEYLLNGTTHVEKYCDDCGEFVGVTIGSCPKK